MIKKLFSKIGIIYKNFALELTIMFILAIYLIEFSRTKFFKIEMVFLALSTFFLLVGFKYKIRNKKYIILAVASSVILGFLSGMFNSKVNDITSIHYNKMLFTLLLSFLLMTVIPFLRKEKREEIDTYTIFLAKNLFFTTLISIILYLGLAGMVELVNYLIIKLDSKIFEKLFIAVTFIFAPYLMFSFYPDNLNEIEKDNTKIIKFILMFILIPILSIYTLVMYLYLVKILITFAIPKGEVSQLILIYGLIIIIIILLLRGSSIIKEKTRRYIERIFFIAELPLIVLLFTAVFQRIEQYGMTINRYMILIFGVWLLITSIYNLIFRKNKTFFTLVSFSIFLFFSLYGPLSVFKYPFYQQEKRLNKILKENSIDLKKTNFQNIDNKTKKEILSIINYFERYDNYSLKNKGYYDDSVVKLSESLEENIDNNYGHYYFKIPDFLDIKDYDIYFQLNIEKKINYNDYEIIIEENNNDYYDKSILIKHNDKIIKKIETAEIKRDIKNMIDGKEIKNKFKIILNGEQISDFNKAYPDSDLEISYIVEEETIKFEFLISQFNLDDNLEESYLIIDSVLVKF